MCSENSSLSTSELQPHVDTQEEEKLKESRRKFIMDYSVNKIAKYFRLLGYDTICSRNISHDNLLRVAAREERTIITCSRALDRQVHTHNIAVRRRMKKAMSMHNNNNNNNSTTYNSESIMSTSYNAEHSSMGKEQNTNQCTHGTCNDKYLYCGNNNNGACNEHFDSDTNHISQNYKSANNVKENRVVVAYDSDGESIYSEIADDECVFMERELSCYYVNQWRNCEFQQTMVDLIKRLKLKFNVDVVFSRCATCNTVLLPIAKSKVRARVEAKVYNMFAGFTECSTCEKVYWGFEDGHVSNYKTYRTLDMLQSLCAAAETAIIAPLAPLCTLKSFTAFPRKVKINIFGFLTEDELDVLTLVFPLLKQVISEEKNSRVTGEEVKPFRCIRKRETTPRLLYHL